MDKKPLAATMFVMLAFLSGFAYSYFEPTVFFDFGRVPLTILVGIHFIFGTVFFGFFAFIPSLLLGLQMGAEKNAAMFMYIIPLALASYAGTKIGFSALEDFLEEKNISLHMKKIFTILIVAVVLSIVIEQILPWLIELWPAGTGLDMRQGKTALELLDELRRI